MYTSEKLTTICDQIRGLQEEFSCKKEDFETNYDDYLNKMICTDSFSDCYSSKCGKYAFIINIADHLMAALKNHKIETVT